MNRDCAPRVLQNSGLRTILFIQQSAAAKSDPDEHSQEKSTGRNRTRTRKILRWLRFCVLAFFLFSFVQVLALRWIDPPLTVPMALRSLEGEPESSAQSARKYQWIAPRDMSRTFVLVALAGEDARFFHHWGFDWVEIRNAWRRAQDTGSRPRGASTITQQCARSIFLWHGRSWVRKALESYYTVLMEFCLSKHRILELYLNVIELGDNIYGMEAGAQHHFNKPARELTDHEASMLAAILPSPTKWDPNRPNERMLKRQEILMQRIGEMNYPFWAHE